MDYREELRQQYNAAIANGHVIKAKRIGEVMDAIDRAFDGTLETVEFDWKNR